ncbi:hypothetical protein R6Q59_005685 [Mikania micrantha]
MGKPSPPIGPEPEIKLKISFLTWMSFKLPLTGLEPMTSRSQEPPVEYSYGTIDLNAEHNADVGFDSQASYGFVYVDSKQSNPEEGYEEKPAASNVNWETKEIPLSDIDIFWTKLNASNPTLLEEEEEEIDVIGQMSLVFPNKSDKKAPLVQKDTRGRPTLKAQKQKDQDVVKDNLASQESTFKPSRHSLFTAVTENGQKPVFRHSRSTSVSKAMPPSDSLSQNE